MISSKDRKKIILGTASFDRNYGINKSIFFKKNEKNLILKKCIQNKILYVDCSENYNSAMNYFYKKKGILKNFKVIYKINIKNFSPALEKKLYLKMDIVLKKLDINNFYCVMLHNGEALQKKIGPKIHNFLLNLKRIKKTNKIGISTYDLNVTKSIISKFKFDVLQFPYNLFDQRINSKFFLNILNKNKVEIHLRSIFLQGLFTLDEKKIPKYFDKWKKNINEIKLISKKYNISIINLCISHALDLNYKDKKIIIGIKNLHQLNEIIQVKKCKIKNLQKLRVTQKKLILPYLWKTT